MGRSTGWGALPYDRPHLIQISAVIPTRNRPELLRAAVDSVRRQTVPAIDIVIVDEGSDPPVNTWLSDPDIAIVRHETPRGPAAARNTGAARSHGSHIAFLDDDDVWLDQKLEMVARCLSANPAVGAVFHQLGDWGRVTSGTVECVLLEDPVARMLGPHPPHLSTLVVARHVHSAVQFDSAYQAAEDLDYNVRLAATTAVVEIRAVLACSQPRTEGPSDIAIQTRIEAREHFRAQHAALFTEPAFERHHRLQLAHLHRRAGHSIEALRRFASLTRHAPRDVAAWKGLVSSLLPLEWSIRIGSRWRKIRSWP